MAVLIAQKTWSGSTQYISLYNGQGWTGAGMNVGEGLILQIESGYSVTPPVITGATLSVDGACQAGYKTPLRVNGSELQSIFCCWPNITSATQNITVQCSGGSGEGSAYLWTVTGHDTSNMLGNDAYTTSESTPVSLTISSGSAIISALYGSDPQNQVYTGAGGSWSSSYNTNGRSTCWSRYNNTPNSGALSISLISGAVYLNHIAEIKALGGGGGIVPKSTRLTMLGIG